MRWTRSTIASAAIVLAVVLFFAVNIVSNAWLSTARIDLTSVGLYSVSDGTRNILRNLPEQITLRFFFSESASVRYATLRAYGSRVRDLLREYEAISGGKLKLEMIDPEPLSEQEDLAVAQGVTGAPIPNGDKIYFGLVGTNQIDGREVIPFFIEDREEYLEYDLTSLIYRLIREKKPKVGVVSNLPFDTGSGGMMAAMQGRSKPFMIYEQLREAYDVVFLEQDFDRVPADIDVVMIAHPKALDDKTQYALDQFVMRGGRALVFLDPWSEISQLPDESGQPMQGSTSTSTESIPKLLQSWGVSVDGLHVVANADRAQRVAFGGDPVEYVAWLALSGEDMSRSDPVTGELTDLNLGSIGAITQTKGATTKFEPLIETTPNSMEIDVPKISRNPNPDELLRDFVSENKRFVLAARIEGPVKSAFAAPPPVAPAAAGTAAPKPLPPHIAEAKQPANIILVGDADIFTDSFWVQTQEFQGQRSATPFADNAVFVLNAIENLTGSSDLISLRSRGTSKRPFTVVNEIRSRAERAYLRQQQVLQDKLTATQNRLAELQGRRTTQPKPGSSNMQQELVTPEQQAEIEKFKEELIQTRSALRDVQFRLRRDIDRLGNWLAAINVLFVPLVIALTALILAFLRRRPKTKAEAKP